ncbi:hypothetical protein BDW62DRAFT_182970, partial [Aspergillus aurantiobrunneus]
MAQPPQWQIDIPGLTQLVFSAGAHGLKQLALAGVDPHTIGCMLMIAEYTPASQAFRTKLSQAREQQRQDRIWLYKLVEIGTCTNFLADQMLKTRAGENVVALMSAVATVMDDQCCTAVLLALFEAANVSLDNTPGIAQLRNIRSSLVSLAGKTGFAEKTLQYHYFFLALLNKKDGPLAAGGSKISPYEGLPDAKDIPKKIQLMHKLIRSDEQRCHVRYRGLRGAAWMATYSSFILGLGTCAVRADGTPVPMTSSYEEARVIFEIAAPESTSGLYVEGDLQDLISLEAGAVSISSGWRIDCSLVDFANLHHPDLRTSQPVAFARVSTYAAIVALNLTSALCSAYNMGASDSTWYCCKFPASPGFLSSALAALPEIQARALRILKILGFRPPEAGYRFRPRGGATTYTCYGHESDPEPIRSGSSSEEPHDADSPVQNRDKDSKSNRNRLFSPLKDLGRQRKRPKQHHPPLESRRGQYTEQDILPRDKETIIDQLKDYLDDYTRPELFTAAANWPRETLSDLIDTITVAVHFASRLAFTDWDTSLRTISASTMAHRQLPYLPPGISALDVQTKEAIAMCSDSIPIDAIEQHLWNPDWVALDIDGIVVLRNAATPSTWAGPGLSGTFLSFRRGRIIHGTQQYAKIRTDRANTLAQPPLTLNRKSHNRKPHNAISTTGIPTNAWPEIQSRTRTLITPTADTLFLRFEMTLSPGEGGQDILVTGDGSLSAKFVSDYLVTIPCAHGYMPTTKTTTPILARPIECHPLIRSIAAGFFFS